MTPPTMVSQATEMFTKLLTHTDITKRLAIPAKTLPFLPSFNETHAVRIHIRHGTRTWPIACTIRKKGYKKPVFSGGLWRSFVNCNDLNVGDIITMYKVKDDFMVRVEKPTAGSQYKTLSVNHREHEVDETSLMVLAKVATDTFIDRVVAKPSTIRIFGTDMSDNEEAHSKCSSNCVAKETATCYGTSDATEESCCRLSLDMVATPSWGEVNLDLTLAQPISDGVIVEGSEQ